MRLLQRRERRTRLSLARSGQSGASGSRRARAVGLRTPGCLAMESTPPRFTIPPGARKEACRTISARPVGNDDAWRSRPSPGRTFFLRPVIHWLACRARNDFAMREGAKSALVAQLEPCRRIVIVVGRRMHAAACSMTPMTCSSSPGLTLKPSCARGGTAKAPALWSPTEKHSAKPGVRSPPDVIIMNASDAARAQTTLTRSSEGTAAGAPYDAAQKGSRDAAGPTLRAPAYRPEHKPFATWFIDARTAPPYRLAQHPDRSCELSRSGRASKSHGIVRLYQSHFNCPQFVLNLLFSLAGQIVDVQHAV